MGSIRQKLWWYAVFAGKGTFVPVELPFNVTAIRRQFRWTGWMPPNLETANATLGTPIESKPSATQTVLFLTMCAMPARRGSSVKK